jgi:hypothetical protein
VLDYKSRDGHRLIIPHPPLKLRSQFQQLFQAAHVMFSDVIDTDAISIAAPHFVTHTSSLARSLSSLQISQTP